MNLLLPSPVAAAVITLYGILSGMPSSGENSLLNLTIFAFLFCYFYGFIPSAIYTVIAEVLYRLGLSPNSKKAVAIAVAFGALAAVVSFVYQNSEIRHNGHEPPVAGNLRAVVEYLIVGIGTGLIIGLLVKAAAKRALAAEKRSPASS